MTDTPRLALPLIEAAQAQKHVTHNEALLRLDAEVQLAVIDRDRTAPPPAPTDGDCHIVAAGATGAWAGQAGTVAARRSGAWAFLTPCAGWLCWVVAESRLLVHDGTSWTDFADRAGLVRAGALADGSTTRLGVNTAADATNRLAVKSDAVLLAADDVSGLGSGDIRVALAKTATARDAALQFETAWSPRALFGLLGGDDVSLKVSPDGTTWTEAMHVAVATGRLSLLPGGLAGGGRLLASRLFTSSATWTRPSGVRFALVWALGGGGGGGGAAGAASSGAAGGGGGAGGMALAFLDVSAVASRAVTIGSGGSGGTATGGDGGSGGATSFGSDVDAAGGGGGKGMSAGTFGTAVTGGLGGSTSAGDIGFPGAPGSPGLRFDGANVLSGNGGASYFGGGARGNVGNVAGGIGSALGSGGSGASVATSASGLVGGAGGAGLVWIWEFE